MANKIKNLCNHCNSIANIKLKEMDFRKLKPLLEQKYKLINQIGIMKELANEEFRNTTKLFVGDLYFTLFNRSKRMVNLLEYTLEDVEKTLSYTHYYKCPTCNLNNFITIGDALVSGDEQ